MTAPDKEMSPASRRDDAPEIGRRCLLELRKIRERILKLHGREFDIFDFGLDVDFRSNKVKDIENLMRACIWHAIALKTEFKLKLLYSIDGYLSAVETKNPVSSFLLARYLLELVATVSEIDLKLEECIKVDLTDWGQRAAIFLAVLYRARHSTSNDKHKVMFDECGIPAELFRPIKISKAIKRLASRPGFKSAVSTYHSLSNMCHHNGSGHKLLIEDVQETNTILTPSGKLVLLNKKVMAMTMGYPARNFTERSLTGTAQIAWWSAKSADELIGDLREAPFTDRDLYKITNGRLKSAHQFFYGESKNLSKIGRNDLCPCGSGKKYKYCCGR